MRPSNRFVVLTVAALLTATAALAVAASLSTAQGPTLRTTVYFLTERGSAPLGVRRTVPRKAPYAREALSALLAGPSRGEARSGLSTAIPRTASLRSLEIRGARAVVDLAGLPPVEKADAVVKARVITQVARTLVGLSGIERVQLRGDGRPWGLWNQQGEIIDVAYGYRELLGLSGICTGRPGADGRAARCFTALP